MIIIIIIIIIGTKYSPAFLVFGQIIILWLIIN